MELTTEQQLKAVIGGAARLQARQEMLECIVRALIVTVPPTSPVWMQALSTAKSDHAQRTARARAHNPPEIDAAALSLWNELWRAAELAAAAGQPPAPAA